MLSRKALDISRKLSSNNEIFRRYASNLGFIGIGNMGVRMARNLIKKGNSIQIYDVVAANAKAVEGAKICSTPEEAAKGASIVITMLPNGEIVKDAIFGEKGVLQSISKNALVVDSSTIEPNTAQEISKNLTKSNIRFIDAPVSGGVVGAEAGTLTFMVGGNKDDLKEVQPVLLNMGARVFHCGDVGAGQITKLCNNLILAVTMIGTCEAMNLGIKLGLDPKTLTSVVNVSTGRSWSSDTYNPVPGIMENVPASNDYKGGFGVRLVAKDLGLAEKAAVTCDAPVPLGAAAHQIYRTLIANGFGDKDFAFVYKFLKGN